MSHFEIRVDDLTGEEIARLLQEHLDDMNAISPADSVHALDLEALRSPDVTFWSVWQRGELLGCAALKELDEKTGEIKSMRTAVAHRGKGVASQALEHILEEAGRRAYECLNLETGSTDEFLPARKLYLRYGFEYRGPFAHYTLDPHSTFMSKKL